MCSSTSRYRYAHLFQTFFWANSELNQTSFPFSPLFLRHGTQSPPPFCDFYFSDLCRIRFCTKEPETQRHDKHWATFPPKIKWKSTDECKTRVNSIPDELAAPDQSYSVGINEGETVPGDNATPYLLFPTIEKDEIKCFLLFHYRTDVTCCRYADRRPSPPSFAANGGKRRKTNEISSECAPPSALERAEQKLRKYINTI